MVVHVIRDSLPVFIPTDSNTALLHTVISNRIVSRACKRHFPDRWGLWKAIGVLIGVYCRGLCGRTEFFKYTIGNLIGDVAGVFFSIFCKNRANAFNKILVAERLVERRKFDPSILPVLPVSLQDCFVVFCLNRFQWFSLYDRHGIIDCLVGLSRSGRTIEDRILCKRHGIVHLFLRQEFQCFCQFITELPGVCAGLILEGGAAYK